ncbi:hypothetical protein HDC33_000759 [Sporosarcina sp. JAI121]|nr:hypothetical protein [Sporosarcina sp. JAI121]
MWKRIFDFISYRQANKNLVAWTHVIIQKYSSEIINCMSCSSKYFAMDTFIEDFSSAFDMHYMDHHPKVVFK